MNINKKQFIFLLIAVIFLASGIYSFLRKNKNNDSQIKFSSASREIPQGMPENYLYDRSKIAEIYLGEKLENKNIIDRNLIFVLNEDSKKVLTYYENLYNQENWEIRAISDEEKSFLQANTLRIGGVKGNSILVVDITELGKNKTQVIVRYEEQIQ